MTREEETKEAYKDYMNSDSWFLGCATEEIARHFSKYFGMLITEAKYSDLKDFEIVDSYYKN